MLKDFPELAVVWMAANVFPKSLRTFQQRCCRERCASYQYHQHTPIPSQMLAFEVSVGNKLYTVL